MIKRRFPLGHAENLKICSWFAGFVPDHSRQAPWFETRLKDWFWSQFWICCRGLGAKRESINCRFLECAKDVLLSMCHLNFSLVLFSFKSCLGKQSHQDFLWTCHCSSAALLHFSSFSVPSSCLARPRMSGGSLLRLFRLFAFYSCAWHMWLVYFCVTCVSLCVFGTGEKCSKV